MALFDAFLKLDGIKGESTDKTHKDEIELESYSLGASQGGTFGSGTGGGAGKVNFQDIHFTKRVDKASANLFLFCASGKHVKEALLTVRKAGDKPLEYLKIKLTDVLISSVQDSGTGQGNTIPTESVSINFSKIHYDYYPQKADGTGDAPIQMGWDVKANVKA